VGEKALKLADEVLAKEYAPRIEIAKELRRLHSENEQLKAREWVGLTDEEIKEIIGPWGDTPIKGYTRKLFDQIETKLREKNGG
jgi:hypothetical protein